MNQDRVNKRGRTDNKKNSAEKSGTGVCPAAKHCGGCTMQGMPYKKQLEKKQRLVEEQLKGFCPVRPIIGMKQPFHYRNKVHAVFARARGGKILSGIYEEGTHRVVPVDSCMIEDQAADAIIRDIRDLLPSFKIRPYDEDTGYGLFRHVLVRAGYYSKEMMVVLVLASPVLPSKNHFVKALCALHPEITTIVLNVNDQKTSMVLGTRNIVLYGRGYIEDQLCGCTFRISPNSFYQVNPVQTEILYTKALELAHLTGEERVIDAYCGTGTIGIIASTKAKEVLGIELNPDAVRDAVFNAKRNRVHNIRFYQADAGDFMVQMAKRGEKADVVIMDPPRSGCSEAFIRSVQQLAPKSVVYVSCNPETLVRDLKLFQKKGYPPVEAVPVDMFPWTSHVETVCLLSKLHEAKHHVNVIVDMDEMDVTSAESKATYEEIKKYVAEHNDGMRVSNLYIAQVKKKCGIIERENYNKPKLEDEKQPQCPKDKEKAIEDALRYFQMI